jgi:hypothetical protein
MDYSFRGECFVLCMRHASGAGIGIVYRRRAPIPAAN